MNYEARPSCKMALRKRDFKKLNTMIYILPNPILEKAIHLAIYIDLCYRNRVPCKHRSDYGDYK